jgi:3-(3-hydroxy-phenyl)propionate hydroxylase
MTEHAVVIAGGGPTGMMLAGELALAGVDVAIVERRTSQDLIGSRAGGLHARTIDSARRICRLGGRPHLPGTL